MSVIYSTRNERIKENLDRIFGDSIQGRELKAICLKAQTEGFTEEEMKKYWDDKEKEIAELKERMPVVGDLALPVESKVFYAESSNLIVNGTIDVSERGEDGRGENPAIKHEVISGDTTERGQKITYSL
jgi:hypothetical protein